MRLFEYEGKRILSRFGIRVPRGIYVRGFDELEKLKEKGDVSFPLLLKAQVLVGGRKKAGGIVSVENMDELLRRGMEFIRGKVRGEKVEGILVEEKVDVSREMYLSIAVDREERSPIILASNFGGVDIEEVAERDEKSIVKVYVDPIIGLMDYHVRYVLRKLKLEGELKSEMAYVLKRIWNIFNEMDAELVEINPLAVTKEKKLIALDAKMVIDDNSIFRHPELKGRRFSHMSQAEIDAFEVGLSYVELDGDVGIIGNGAGLVMATMDLVRELGGKPADFLDIGGGASSENIRKALEILNSRDEVKVIFINVMGGITKCDEIAEGIVKAVKSSNFNKRLVIRMIGTNEDIGRSILEKEGIKCFSDMEKAAKVSVKMVEGHHGSTIG
ncbi:MAG: ADP-forming succinate--CoA ligase subunit beta [Candidatus Asgardarchaeia archaeon]